MGDWRGAFLALAVLIATTPAAAAEARAGGETVTIGWLSQAIKRMLPLSYLDQPPQDEGIQGARLGIADDQTTGRFTGQSFELIESITENEDIATSLRQLAGKGVRLIVTDLAAAELLSVAGMPEAASARSLTGGRP